MNPPKRAMSLGPTDHNENWKKARLEACFSKCILLRVYFASACVATYTYDFPAYNVPTTLEPTTSTTTTTTSTTSTSTTTTTTTTTCPSSGPCQAGWTQFGTNCYYKSSLTDWVTGDDAIAKCMDICGQLASIHSQAEQDFIYRLIGTSPNYWIGLYRTCPTNGNNCFANRDLSPTDYFNWSGTGPDNAGGVEYCITMLGQNGGWNDFDCADSNPYVCKRAI